LALRRPGRGRLGLLERRFRSLAQLLRLLRWARRGLLDQARRPIELLRHARRHLARTQGARETSVHCTARARTRQRGRRGGGRQRDRGPLDLRDRRIASRIAGLGRVVRATELAEAALAIDARVARAVGGVADAGEAGAG